MTEWRETTLGDLVRRAGGFIKTGPFGSQLHAHEYTDDPGGVPVIMPKDMLGGRVARATVSRVDEIVADRLSAHRLVPGDVVLARRGDIGRHAFVGPDEGGWLCGTGSLRVHAPDPEVIWPLFLRYTMGSPSIVDWLSGQAVGATMPNLNAKIVAEVPLRLPDLTTQRRIAAVLAAFDELIESNERRIELLEDLARSLYREWFVRFRFPGHTTPSEGLPDRWQRRSASRVFNVNPRVRSDQAVFPRVTMGDVDERYAHVFPSGIVARASGSRFQRDDVLFARITPCLENGKTALAHFLEPGVMGVGSTEFIVLRGVTVGPAFTYCAARSDAVRQHAIKSMSGASGRQRVASNAFDSLELVEPSADVAAAFERCVGPLLEEGFALALQDRELARTRDLLRSRLVTGRLDISEVDLGDLLPEQIAA